MTSLLDRLFQKRATINSPSTPISEAYDILVQGEQTDTGLPVTETKALGQAAFWKGVNLISRAIGKTSVGVKKRVNESLVVDREHPAWYLLKKLPTGFSYDVPCTPFIFKQVLQAAVLIHGNGYAYIVRNNNAEPTGLIWMDPRGVVPIKENGRLLYIVSLNDGQFRRVNPMNVLHIRGLSYDGITGYSVLEVLKNTISLNMAYEKNQSVFFKNGMRPGWVIEVPYKFRDEDSVKEFRKRLGKLHQGIERAHIPAILENGAKATALNISREESQFLQSREFDLRQLANIFFLPSSKFNDIAKIAYNSLEQENQSVLNEAYEPWFVIWEEEFEFKLLSEEQKIRDSHAIKFDRRDLVQTPFKDRIEGYNKGVLGGYFSRDEVRQWEDLNPMPEGEGEKFFQPVNVTTTGQSDGENGDVEIEDDRVSKAYRIVCEQLSEVVIRLYRRRIGLACKRCSTDTNKFMEWLLDELIQRNEKAFCELIQPKIDLIRLLDNKDTLDISCHIRGFLTSIRNDLNQLAGMVSKENLALELDSFIVKNESKVITFIEGLKDAVKND